jgi:hypothetical protein
MRVRYPYPREILNNRVFNLFGLISVLPKFCPVKMKHFCSKTLLIVKSNVNMKCKNFYLKHLPVLEKDL